MTCQLGKHCKLWKVSVGALVSFHKLVEEGLSLQLANTAYRAYNNISHNSYFDKKFVTASVP